MDPVAASLLTLFLKTANDKALSMLFADSPAMAAYHAREQYGLDFWQTIALAKALRAIVDDQKAVTARALSGVPYAD